MYRGAAASDHYAWQTRGPFVARNIADEREVLVIGFIDLPDPASLDAAMTRLAKQEQVRHDRVAEVIESTTLRGIYEVSDEFDFSTNATVAAGRPSRSVRAGLRCSYRD